MLGRVSVSIRAGVRHCSAFTKQYEMLSVEQREKVCLITLNRPKALNALCTQLLHELDDAVSRVNADPEIGATVLTGSKKAFAAGADIKEMSDKTNVDCMNERMFSVADTIAKQRKPLIAAVNGYALGGGCELAMLCDFIIAGDAAIFGQPEITLGTIPGIGGTQRLTRAIGKAKAMELVLTGARMTAADAERAGLVSRIVPADTLVDDAVKTAQKIASFSKPVVAMAKDCVNRAHELPLGEGLNYERQVFYSTFALKDQKEGMGAFVSKRSPSFTDE